MNVWPTVAPFYDSAARGLPVYATVNYHYWENLIEKGEYRGISSYRLILTVGQVNPFQEFKTEEAGLVELVMGLRGQLDSPSSVYPQAFFPVELEIRHEPLEGKTVTTIDGVPNRPVSGEISFDDTGDAHPAGDGSYSSLLPNFPSIELIEITLQEPIATSLAQARARGSL